MNTGTPYTPNSLLELPFEQFKQWNEARRDAMLHARQEATAVNLKMERLADACYHKAQSRSLDARDAFRGMRDSLARLGKHLVIDLL